MIIQFNLDSKWFEEILGREISPDESSDITKYSEEFFSRVLQGTSRNIDLTWFFLTDDVGLKP